MVSCQGRLPWRNRNAARTLVRAGASGQVRRRFVNLGTWVLCRCGAITRTASPQDGAPAVGGSRLRPHGERTDRHVVIEEPAADWRIAPTVTRLCRVHLDLRRRLGRARDDGQGARGHAKLAQPRRAQLQAACGWAGCFCLPSRSIQGLAARARHNCGFSAVLRGYRVRRSGLYQSSRVQAVRSNRHG